MSILGILKIMRQICMGIFYLPWPILHVLLEWNTIQRAKKTFSHISTKCCVTNWEKCLPLWKNCYTDMKWLWSFNCSNVEWHHFRKSLCRQISIYLLWKYILCFMIDWIADIYLFNVFHHKTFLSYEFNGFATSIQNLKVI